ncbi:MAG: outer membrane protein assembly factor, partial [Muribaculaceae bacterium]|nr:outer membrane protein assembly factor [Muribaculaceae bacterium]
LLPLSAVLLSLLGACSTTRHVPAGEFLLNKVNIDVDSTVRNVDDEELLTYLRQQPNHRMLWSARLRLGIYNLSGNDTTKWWNRWLRKMGEPPVIYDPTLTRAGANQMQLALVNKGYLGATVEPVVKADTAHRKINVEYDVHPGKAHVVRNIDYQVSDSVIASLVLPDTARWGMRPGDLLDRNVLEAQRQFVASRLHNHGYYKFAKENVAFVADTTAGSYDVDLTMQIDTSSAEAEARNHTIGAQKYIVRRVICVTDYRAGAGADFYSLQVADTVNYRNMTILYGKSHYLRPAVIYENNYIRPGYDYSEHEIDRTYKAFSRLEILKFVNIRFEPVGEIGGVGMLDAYILLTPSRSQSMSAELEGTNSEGDLGVAVALSYAHRN